MMTCRNINNVLRKRQVDHFEVWTLVVECSKRQRIFLGISPPAVGNLPDIATEVWFNSLELPGDFKFEVVAEEELLCLLVDLLTSGSKIEPCVVSLAGTPTVITNRARCNNGEVVDTVSKFDWQLLKSEEVRLC